MVSLAEEIAKEELLIWEVPTLEIRNSFDNKTIFKLILKVHGLDELFSLSAPSDDIFMKSLEKL